jgi:hypothetical protein
MGPCVDTVPSYGRDGGGRNAAKAVKKRDLKEADAKEMKQGNVLFRP